MRSPGKQVSLGRCSFYNNRGVERWKHQALKGAMADFNRAIQTDPGCHHAHVNRSALRYELGDMAGAIEDATRSAKLARQRSTRYFPAYLVRGLARVCVVKSDLDLARADLLRALRWDSTDRRVVSDALRSLLRECQRRLALAKSLVRTARALKREKHREGSLQ